MSYVKALAATALVAAAALLLVFSDVLRADPTGHSQRPVSGESLQQKRTPAPGAALLVTEVRGPSAVGENSGERFALLARYEDGAVVDVTNLAEWQVDSEYAMVSAGFLRAFEVPEDQKITLTAWYTDGLSIKATYSVTIEDRGQESVSAGEWSTAGGEG